MPYNNPIPERKSNSKSGAGLQSLVQAEKLLQIAIILPSAMFIGWLAGAFADMKLHQSWLTIVGVILGCVAGLYSVVRLAIDAEKSAGKSDASGKAGNSTGGPQ